MLDTEIAKAKEYFDKMNIKSKKQQQALVCQQKNNTNNIETNINKSRNLSNVKISDSRLSVNKKRDSLNSDPYDYGHADSSIMRNSFFNRPSGNKPYQFNYEKIFDLGVKNPVKDAASKALRNSSSGDMSIDHNQAVRDCCKAMWTEEVRNYNKLWAEKQREIKRQPPPPEKKNLGYDLPYYDPRNKNLMDEMLYKAIQEMRKNKKFVLATLPDAHKIPILKEFIRRRYGMVYTKKEKTKAFKLTNKIFRALQKENISVTIPQVHDVSKKRIVTYGCKDYILRKTNLLKERYQHNFKMNLLEAVRIYWGAVRPYQCSKGPPRNEFFSYLPARENDIHMFRPWQVGEYIRAKEQWVKRQRLKRMEALY